MPTFNERLAEASNRMNSISLYLFTEALNQPGAKIARGRFYTGGPVCVQVTYPGMKYPASIQEALIPHALLSAIDARVFWSDFWQDLACYYTRHQFEMERQIAKFQTDHAIAFYTEYRQQVMEMIDVMIEIGIPTDDNRFNALYILAGDITRLLLSLEGPLS